MLLILIVPLILSIIIFIVLKNKTEDAAAIGLLLYPVFCFIGIITTLICMRYNITNTYTAKKIKLVNLQDNIISKSTSFLLYNQVNNTAYYFFYKQNGDQYTLDKIKAKNVIIKYGTPPRLEIIKTYLFLKLNVISSQYIFYTPNGAIKTNFILDAK